MQKLGSKHGGILRLLRRWQVGVFLLGVCSMGTAIAVRPLLELSASERAARLIGSAERSLQAGQPDRAAQFASEACRLAASGPEPLLREALALAGEAKLQLARVASRGSRVALAREAAGHLLEAARHDGPSPPAERLLLEAAKALRLAGDPEGSLPLLQRACRGPDTVRAEAIELLADTALAVSPAQLQLAWQANLQLLDLPRLSREQIAAVWARRNTILKRQDRLDWLAGIEPSDFEHDAGLCRTLLQLDEALQRGGGQRLLRQLESLLRSRRLPPRLARRLRLLQALAYQSAGKPEQAVPILKRIAWAKPTESEKVAAEVLLGQALLAAGRADEAVETLLAAVRTAQSSSICCTDTHASHAPAGSRQRRDGTGDRQPPARPEPAIFSAQRLADLLWQTIATLQAQDRYALAAKLIEPYRSLSRSELAERRAADFYAAWASRLDTATPARPPEQTKPEELPALKGELYATAARLYEQLAADATAQPAKCRDYLQAARCYAAAGDSEKGYEAVKLLLAAGAKGRQRREALSLACRMLADAGRLAELKQIADYCLRGCNDPSLAADARYFLALCQAKDGRAAEAERNLLAILEQPHSPDEPLQQAARYALAKLYRDQGRFQESVAHLQQLISLPGNGSLHLNARWLLADCYRQLASEPAARLVAAKTDRAKAHYRRLKEQLLQEAVSQLQAIQARLSDGRTTGLSDSRRKQLLLDCRWALADCLYELERYEETMSVCELIRDNATRPEDWLQAQVQIANCYARMGKVEQARTVLHIAQQRMAELPPKERARARVGLRTRRWEAWADEVTKLR